MESWQIVFISISGFIGVIGTIFGVMRFNYYTKKDMDDKLENYQSLKYCSISHDTHEARHASVAKMVEEIKADLRDFKKDIESVKIGVSHSIDALSNRLTEILLSVKK